MNDLNTVVINGRLVKDAETQVVNEKNFIKFAVANNRQHGEKEETNYFDVTYVTKSDKLTQYLTKGTKLSIAGELKQERWTSQDGSTKQRVVLYANNLQFFGTSNKQTETPKVENDKNEKDFFDDDFNDSDIPF